MKLKTLPPRIQALPDRLQTIRGTPRQRGRPWMRVREQVLSASPLCVACEAVGVTRLATEVDHVVPLHRGGSNALANLQGLCRECHAEKTASEAGER